MNEKIKDFLEQAYTYSFQENRGQFVLNDFAEKFAELIIQECVKHITDQQDLVETNWGCKDGIHIVYSLKEHFGVEE